MDEPVQPLSIGIVVVGETHSNRVWSQAVQPSGRKLRGKVLPQWTLPREAERTSDPPVENMIREINILQSAWCLG